jgi:hypothetical protein
VGEERLVRSAISVRCLLPEDQTPVDNPGEEGVEAIVGRAY